jgi:hypothetical protein
MDKVTRTELSNRMDSIEKQTLKSLNKITADDILRAALADASKRIEELENNIANLHKLASRVAELEKLVGSTGKEIRKCVCIGSK